jgi:hypothetical protein
MDKAKQDAGAPPAKAPETAPLRGTEKPLPPEQGGRTGPEPTRYGDWEVKGICTDF